MLELAHILPQRQLWLKLAPAPPMRSPLHAQATLPMAPLTALTTSAMVPPRPTARVALGLDARTLLLGGPCVLTISSLVIAAAVLKAATTLNRLQLCLKIALQQLRKFVVMLPSMALPHRVHPWGHASTPLQELECVLPVVRACHEPLNRVANPAQYRCGTQLVVSLAAILLSRLSQLVSGPTRGSVRALLDTSRHMCLHHMFTA